MLAQALGPWPFSLAIQAMIFTAAILLFWSLLRIRYLAVTDMPMMLIVLTFVLHELRLSPPSLLRFLIFSRLRLPPSNRVWQVESNRG